MGSALLPSIQADHDAIEEYLCRELTVAGLNDDVRHLLSTRVLRQMRKWLYDNELITVEDGTGTLEAGVYCSVTIDALVAVYGYIYWRQNL